MATHLRPAPSLAFCMATKASLLEIPDSPSLRPASAITSNLVSNLRDLLSRQVLISQNCVGTRGTSDSYIFWFTSRAFLYPSGCVATLVVTEASLLQLDAAHPRDVVPPCVLPLITPLALRRCTSSGVGVAWNTTNAVPGYDTHPICSELNSTRNRLAFCCRQDG